MLFKPAASKMLTLGPEEGRGCDMASVLRFQNRLRIHYVENQNVREDMREICKIMNGAEKANRE